MKFKNMKIEINESQSLDVVVKELERLGYLNNQFGFDIGNHRNKDSFKSIASYEIGKFNFYMVDVDMINFCDLTTLPELREMK